MFRTALLYHALEPHFDVEIVGFDRGGGIWAPLRNAGLKVRFERYGSWPVFLLSCMRILKGLHCDVVIASKPRLPSFGIGLLNRLLRKTPVIVDNEDDELAMTRPPVHVKLFQKIVFHLQNPDAHLPTRLMHRFVRRSDHVFVVSTFFKSIFGGTIVPHGLPIPASPSDDEVNTLRTNHGLEGSFVVVFVGAPRAHKGIVETLDAAGMSGIPGVQVLVVGANPEDDYAKDLSRRYGTLLRIVPPVPSTKVPAYLALGDVTVLAQQFSEEAMGQMPAKLTDAMSAGIPIIATRVSDIPIYLEGCGVLIDSATPEAIAEGLRWVHSEPKGATELGKRARRRAIEQLTDTAIADIMVPVINGLLVDGRGNPR